MDIEQQNIHVVVQYGHVKLNSWFEPINGKLVGMGSATTYDKGGNMVSHKVSPTGIVLNSDIPAGLNGPEGSVGPEGAAGVKMPPEFVQQILREVESLRPAPVKQGMLVRFFKWLLG